jgi:hypothetical protein
MDPAAAASMEPPAMAFFFRERALITGTAHHLFRGVMSFGGAGRNPRSVSVV